MRLGQHVALEEVVRQRQAAADGASAARQRIRDEMRGELYTLGRSEFIAPESRGRANGEGLSTANSMDGRLFTRSEIVSILKAMRAQAGNVADVEYVRMIQIFSAME